MKRFWLLFVFVFGFSQGEQECSHTLYEAKGAPRPGSNGFSLEILPTSEKESNDVSGYVPGKSYKSEFLPCISFW